ncbi:neuroglian-like [Mytilus californianus]|uniref:neuroglian-like n=1 Tax=Mytilus californianus TaxID=6549 RepID=UPI002247517B|nr:neuroglian-like [Mytilus californianus]
MDLEGNLYITAVIQEDYQDGKTYVCTATNYFMRKSTHAPGFIVQPIGSAAKPYWAPEGEPQDIEASVGSSATFFCKALGDPKPDLEWYINGIRLEDSKHHSVRSVRFMKPDDHNITIINLEKSDVMVLQCNASNIYGYVFADFYLNVLKEKPQFIKRPVKELKVAETTNVYLTCQTSGKPDPIVTWYKGTQQITGGRYQTQTNGDLFISNIVLSDAGNFTCVAENEEGSATDWGVLIVRRKTTIEQKPGDLENMAGTEAKFTCSGTTDFEEVANLRVYWLKDGKEITGNDQRMTTNVQDNSLTVSGTISRDSGLYSCVITNGLDKETTSAILTVKEPDSSLRVENFVVDNVAMEENSVKFYWNWDMDLNNNLQSGLHGKFRGFKLQYWIKDMKRVTFREDEILQKDLKSRYGAIQKRSVTELMYTVKDLLQYTYMEAQICVMNTHYVSGPSAIVSFVTARGVPGPVENLRALVVGSNFVELTWNKPELLKSPDDDITNTYLQGYDVGFQIVKGLDLGKIREMDPQIVDPRRNTTVLNGLTANQKYRIYMWGRTENGRGEASFIELTTAATASMSVPRFSIINLNSTFFNITWTTMANRKYGTVAFVDYRKEGVADWQQSPQEISKNWIGIANLKSGTSYEVRLSVTNGWNTASSDIEIIKTKGIPAAFSLGANLNWFIGLIISVLIIMALAALIYRLYKRRPEPTKQRYHTAPLRRRYDYDDDRSDRDYHGDDRGYRDDDEYSRGSYDDENRKADDVYDRQRYDDRYDAKYDDCGKRDDGDDYVRRNDDYDKRRDDDYYDRGHDDNYNKDYRYEDEGRRYSTDRSDNDHYGNGNGAFQPNSRRPYRTPSYDNRSSSNDEDVDLQEPNKFGDDGYPVDTKISETLGASSLV